MHRPGMDKFNRRYFIRTAGSAAAFAAAAGRGVSIVVDPTDPVAAAQPAQWAAGELQESLEARGLSVRRCERLAQTVAGDTCVVASGLQSSFAAGVLRGAGATVAAVPEALGLIPGRAGSRSVLLAWGFDPRGLSYALLELADRVRHAAEPSAALALPKAVTERPANVIRSVTRLFTSDIEDKPWYNDREMWPRYLSMLATQRFNRFNLSFGIGYDFLRNVTDGYFLFAYPFLLAVPGYNVRVSNLPAAERDRNLEMLRFIGEQTVARGMQFQLGIWTHGYEWINSPRPNHAIEGLTPQTHAPYCRDAVRELLKACPAISGVTFRVHGESGIEEGSYDFWKTVFQGVSTCGRTIEIDMHAKGMDQPMIDVALASGMPVKISPKYWAEHLGLPYHQAAIREVEMPRPDRVGTGLMKLSAGPRSFLRYGYGDLLREDRRYGVLHRIWPGTQRLLLWGDPAAAAAYSRSFSFCGSDGVEICEPLSFKGRRGSGIAGGRCAYADASLQPRWDWEKYLYTYGLWGRLIYNPDADPDVWRRYLRKEFGAGAQNVEAALASASRALPLVTAAHGASAGNNTYWPEVYTNQPIVNEHRPHPYRDTPAPRVFGNVSPLDPQLFSRISDFAGELLHGARSGKYSPVEVAQWLEDYAEAATKNLARAEAQAAVKHHPEFRRLSIDVAIQARLARFFGAKLRCGVLYALYERSKERAALEEALKVYRRARAAWAEAAGIARDIYLPDITIGERTELRGHWSDRLPAIDEDIADMATLLEHADGDSPGRERVMRAVQESLGRPQRAPAVCRHTPPSSFRPGQPLEIELAVAKATGPLSAALFYRHVNQAERYETAAMELRENRFRAAVPGAYTDSPYPLQYYFELREAPETASLYPGFSAELTNQPYFLVRRA